MAALALAPKHNAPEIQDIQAVLVTERADTFLHPKHTEQRMAQLDVAGSALCSSWRQTASGFGFDLPGV